MIVVAHQNSKCKAYVKSRSPVGRWHTRVLDYVLCGHASCDVAAVLRMMHGQALPPVHYAYNVSNDTESEIDAIAVSKSILVIEVLQL